MKKRVVEVFPENWPVWVLFDRRLRTQWRADYIGLDYNVLFWLLDRMELSRSEREQMLDDICVLEDAALAEIHSGS